MKLTIYYDDLNFEDIEETPAIEVCFFGKNIYIKTNHQF